MPSEKHEASQFPSIKKVIESHEAARSGYSSDSETEKSQLVEEIESLCMNCRENGTTRILLTKIPFFREVILMSFNCTFCGFENNQVQPAVQAQDQGAKYVFVLSSPDDLNRRVVRSETCSIQINEANLEIPPGRGQLTNIQGLLAMASSDLQLDQEKRKLEDPDVYQRVESVIESLDQLKEGEIFPFTVYLDDPAGNSWIEPSTSDMIGKYAKVTYDRSPEQNVALGLASDYGVKMDKDSDEDSKIDSKLFDYANIDSDEGENASPASREWLNQLHNAMHKSTLIPHETDSHKNEYHVNRMMPELPVGADFANTDFTEEWEENQLYTFPATCPGCNKECITNMKLVNIPFFKQVVLVSTVCDECGYRSTDVKTGGSIPEKGSEITVKVREEKDLSRDILKADSCALNIPELELALQSGTLGGRFTTIEGLLTQIRDDLKSVVYDSVDDDTETGDSMSDEERQKWNDFFAKLEDAINAKVDFTMIMRDPLAQSYVQSFSAPKMDDAISIREFERTDEDNEALGLNDMITEGYEKDEESSPPSKNVF